MITRMIIPRDEPLSPEEIAQIEAAKLLPIVFDEDCPAPTPKTLEAFHRAAIERNRRQARERQEAMRQREVS